MRRKVLTVLIYSFAAIAASFFWITRQQEGDLSAILLVWFAWFAVPLLFVFAYPRFLFADSPLQTRRTRFAAIFHGLFSGVIICSFVILASPFWKNPLRDANSPLLTGVPIVALPVFLVAALSLLFKKRSTLAKFASFLFWPYWLLISLMFVGRFFEENSFRTAFCFGCILSSILFAFAAGAISYRPAVAHASALAGLVSMPWIYWSTLQDSPLGNIWTFFNASGRDLFPHDILRIAALIILSVAMIVLAMATSALRLLPVRWSVRKLPLCERTWPAFGASFVFLAFWFSQSVMPYRISGAVDYGHWPILQILHVEKRGLQFHESCISVGGYRKYPESITFSGNDRRLLQYRFQQKTSSGDLSDALKERIRSTLQSSDAASRNWGAVKPLRAWNDEGWYVSATESIGLRAYTTENGSTPPQEIVDLFNELEKIPHVRETQSERRDVCFGFCYDPLSGLGLLYANHRCQYDGHAYVCR
ncbi:MAG: hypothetical protein ABSG16_23205 [Candidatus Acidiferrum sp.]